jgi:pimeloyl-ACP methyl ester carboxylesterase
MAATEPQTFTRVIDGVELHWSVRGTGRNIVVLHGLSDSERSWWPVMAELGRRHRVFGLDLPGCGLSGRPDASYTIDWQARVVAAWLDELGIAECDVIGHSYGGGLAMWLLLYRAQKIRRLALVASGGLGRAVAPELRLAALPFVVERLGQAYMGKVTELLLAFNGRALTAEDRARLLSFNTSPGTARAFARTVRDVISWRGQKRHFMDRARDAQALPAIAVFWGDQDRIIPIQHGEALCSSIGGCTLHRFAGAGHFLHWERPLALARALLDYLERPHVPRATIQAA